MIGFINNLRQPIEGTYIWKNILVLTFLGLSLFILSSCQNNTGNIDEMFIGTWEAAVGSARVVVIIKNDGSFVSKGYCQDKPTSTTTGSWEVKDNNFTWTYDQSNLLFGAGEKDVNPLLEVTSEKFILKEMGGSISTYKRVDDNKMNNI
ncbi:MAG: hypothetical protein P9X27_00470 [Candidatus Kaelpia aquatica]|nr:hypothetical protein [Candidatus Kaelpia aquatica]